MGPWNYGVIAAGTAVIAFELGYGAKFLIDGDTPECLPVVPTGLQPFCTHPPAPFGLVQGANTTTLQRDPSKDPNDIVGPAGFGAGRFVQNGTLPYTILFENKPEATGPAALVVITERLDDDLDLDTFALGDSGFGDVNVSVPAGRQFYRTRLDLRAARGVFVDVTAELDRPTRVVTWTLTAIDPKTLDIPSDPSVGFLPPDKNQPEGQGYVNYFVAPKADSPTGTRIDAQATIVFESNAPINTPAIFNTLDVGEPESSVSALPAVTNTTNFTVSWFGSDDAGGAPGSGVSLFDVFVSDNGGSFTAFQTGTIATSATFDGAFEHTYRFYSVATDNVGHREMKARTPDAGTTIAVIAPPVTAPAPPTAVYDVFTTSFQTPLVVAAPGVLGNDAPNGGGPMSAALVTNVTRGILVFAADGGFTYTPNSDVAGTDSFTYRAMNSVGPGNDALVNILIGAPLGPQPPTRLFTSSIEGNRVTLRWTPPVVGPTFEYRLEGGLQPGQVLATIATNNPYPIYSFEIPSGAFYVRVCTVSGDELSAPSNEIRVFVNSPVAPTPPSDLVGLASGASLALTWRNTYGGAAPTSLILDVTGSAITSVPLNVTDTFAFPAVPSGTYTFTLRAVNAAGTSAASNPVTLTFPSVCSGAPPTPANFLAYRIGRTLYALWDAAATGPAPTSYQIDISESFTGTFEVTSRSVHAPVSPGLYRISVRAKNICGVSLATAPWFVRVP